MSEVTLTDAPAIPGLRFRMFAGEADLASLVALNNVCGQADGSDWVDTSADAPQWLANMDDKCNFYRDMLFGEVNGQMIAKGTTSWRTNDDGEWIYELDCAVHPDWRGKGIGRALLGWQEQHVRDLVATQDSAGAPKFFESGTESRMTSMIALLQHAGYEAVRFGCNMTRSLIRYIQSSN